MKNEEGKPDLENKNAERLKFAAKSASLLSLGFSMVVAVLIGVALGIFLKDLTGINWLLFVGIFFGIAAAFLNVYKVYQAQLKEYEEEEN